ncbi:MAG: response regulator [Elusimicrobia bacterium]|nr:response regulator [Elusimicrobiota bacterium]
MAQTILIIDDDQVLVETLKEGLESLQYKVVTAYDGLQGVLQAHQAKPDLIVLDFMMPAGGGASVYERLRGSSDTNNTPIVFLTGASAHMLKDKLRSTPFTFFLKKPATLEQIHHVIVKILKADPAAPAQPQAPAQASAQPPAPKAGTAEGAHEFEVRVEPADCDSSGMIRHEAFFKYFEGGRAGLMKSIGLPYPELGVNRQLQIPVYEVRCEFMAPCAMGEALRVQTRLIWVGIASLCFEHEVYGSTAPEKLLAQAFSRHAVVDKTWRPARVPKDLKAVLQPHVREQ